MRYWKIGHLKFLKAGKIKRRSFYERRRRVEPQQRSLHA